jgi:hypothetical protein
VVQECQKMDECQPQIKRRRKQPIELSSNTNPIVVEKSPTLMELGIPGKGLIAGNSIITFFFHN